MENVKIKTQSELLKTIIQDVDHPQMWTHTYSAEDAINYAEKFLAYFELDFVRMYKFAKNGFYEPSIVSSMNVDVFQKIFFEFIRRSIVNYIESIKIDVYDEDFDELDNSVLKIDRNGYDQFYTFDCAQSFAEDLMSELTKFIVGLHSRSDKYLVRPDFEGFLIDGVEIKYDDMAAHVKKEILEFNLKSTF